MSMSTLGAQLAALNGSSVGGSVLPTSRRHEDAVGRGLHHNVQVGYALANKSHMYKASILYETAREASNVPLSTLQENCVTALEELEAVDPYFGTVISQITKSTERGLLTKKENEDLDQTIERLLFRLGVHMTNNELVTPGLNVVEFLMRAHDLHLRPKLISTVLLVWLPHHENAYFLRWLQLVDLASIQTYSWLRPYAVPNAKVGRDVIAKAVSKNLALCREIMQLATKAAYLPNADATLSFTAAVLVEAISLQHRAAGTMEERTGQALIPVIRRACQAANRNPLWANWGYVMASTVVETSSLADGPRKGLVTSILLGISTTDPDGDIPMNDSSTPAVADDETIQNALIVILSLLQQQPPVDSYQRDNDEEEDKVLTQIAVGRDNQVPYGYPNTSIISSKIVWKAMLRVDGLASRLSNLLVEDGFQDVVHWIASLWVVGWKLAEGARGLDSDDALKQFLLDLFQNEKLSQHLWSKPEWIEAVTSFVLTNTQVPEQKGAKADAHSLLRAILEGLRRKSIAAYEQGVARALLCLKRKARSELSHYLGFAANSNLTQQICAGDITYPPRVALDHADIEIRLDAIDRLVAHDEDNDIVTVLLQRVLVEDDSDVAKKATNAICQLMDKKSRAKKHFDHKQVLGTAVAAELVINSLYKWTEGPDSDAKPGVLCHLIQLASMSASKILEIQGISKLFVLLLEATLAFLFHDDASLAKESANGVITALTATKGTKVSNEQALEELMSHGVKLLEYLCRCDEGISVMERVMRRRCIPPILNAYAESLSQRTVKAADERLLPALDYCLWILKTHATSLSTEERRMLLDVLKMTFSQGVENENRLYATLSIVLAYDGVLLDEVITPFVIDTCKRVKQKNGEHASAIAVMMELALRPDTSTNSVEKILLITNGVVPDEAPLCHFGLTYALSLLAHSESSVRKAAILLIKTIGCNLVKIKGYDIKSLETICSYVSENESSAVMGDPAFLAACLRTISTSSTGSGAVDVLSKLILCCMVADASSKSLEEVSKFTTSGFLEFENATGGHVASLALMVAAQSAGESAFPVVSRWSQVAKPVFQFLLRYNYTSEVPSTMQALFVHLVSLLKGIKTTQASGQESSSVIIMSGPGTRGGRKRSYSFGKGETSSFLHPYPKEMSATIVSLLSSRSGSTVLRHVRQGLSTYILCSVSWGEKVFQTLSRSVRQQIVSAILESIIEDLSGSMESAFFSLPLSCDDVADLLKKKGGLASITYLADFTSKNSKMLASGSGIAEVIVALLESFTELSTGHASTDDEGIDFARKSILDALTEVLAASTTTDSLRGVVLYKMTKFDTWVKALIGVINPKKASAYRALASTQSKKSTLSVLMNLCTLYPDVLIEKLIPAITSMVSSAATDRDAVIISELLGTVVPVYLDLASKANLTALELMEAFISACSEGAEDITRIRLYQGFVDAVSGYEKTGKGDLLGSFVSACLAGNLWSARQRKTSPQSVSMVQQILGQISVSKRVQVALAIVAYAREATSLLGGEETEETNNSVSLQNLLKLAVSGPHSIPTTESHLADDTMKELCSALMGASCDIMSSQAFARYLRHATTESSESVVMLWQDLLLIQSICNSKVGAVEENKNTFWSSILDIANETLESIQKHLPSPIFLAFATSLVTESDSEDLSARALQMLSERALQLDPLNTESYLFMDMLPFLTNLVRMEKGMIIRPAALVAIEHITRKICVESLVLGTKYADAVAKALFVTADLFESQSSVLSLTTPVGLDSAEVQLLCTASLCAATAVRACGARALPSLPKLLRPLFKLFGDVNSVLAVLQEEATADDSQLRILQLSSLRLISAVVETIPQFLSPYLEDLFRPNVLSSPSLHTTDNDSSSAVSSAAAKLRETIALKIPSRQLITPLTNGILSSESPAGVTTIVNIMTMSIDHSKPSELGGKTNAILKAGTFVYDFASNADSSSDLVVLATEMFMTLVLKLSELQLRSFYATLRSWRGIFDKERPTKDSFRRYCFWFFSSSLATHIKSIYIPCFTSVFSDVVDELNAAVARLTKRSKESGSKKQRLEGDESAPYDTQTLLSLQAMMKCLEVSLRSDAHDGGTWIRDGESERFDLLVSPLGKLLSCRIRELGPEKPSFRELVQGHKDDLGCVVNCMVALALAAGDEQRWKPLNHIVLQACSHETRPEVRKAGVTCLLSLIQTIGEEYMVLIPECLPVLSELLEDTDEEISGLTQECISMSEELLGESLEDSLR